MNNHCHEIGIPAHLHQNSRPQAPQFDEKELLYRRFFVHPPKSAWLGKENRHKSAKIFHLENDSYNRSKFSQKPEDVLFNINAQSPEDHFGNWGVLSIEVADLQGLVVPAEINGETGSVTFQPVHKPETCMYPHSEIHAFRNGAFIPEVAPKSVRAIVRDILVEICGILKEPE